VGLRSAPELAVADGALGFWQAVEEVWPKTRAVGAALVSMTTQLERIDRHVAGSRAVANS